MKPGFILNCHDRQKNPLFESHDPSMMWDEKSGCYYSYATDTAVTSPYRQGIPVRKSRDLINFVFVGYALSENAIKQGRDNGNYPPTGGFWAPFVEKYGGEYRMYYSATKAFGSSESRIWLATAQNPEGPFENRGVVMDTWDTSDREPNAIDAHIADTPSGEKYLIYGSFFGGIFLKELHPGTGMPADGNEKNLGRRIAVKPPDFPIDGPEGASVLYVPETGYYYLFLSYGWLGDDYDIRVGRSREAAGPYTDFHGRKLDGESPGMKLAGSYRFNAKKPYAMGEEGTDNPEAWTFGGFRGPGHGVPFYDPRRGRYFFVHHVRDGSPALVRKGREAEGGDSYIIHYMTVRAMYFIEGWPVFSPEPFAGEDGKACTYRQAAKRYGWPDGKTWEWLRFRHSDNRMTVAVREALPDDLPENNILVFSRFDFENSRETLALCGLTGQGDTVWGKDTEI